MIPNKVRRFSQYLNGFAALRKDDILLISFPKSGNTWVRFFYAHLIAQKYELDTRDNSISFETLNQLMPELGNSNLKNNWLYKEFPRLVKSHRPNFILFKPYRSILIVRNPYDVMISYYKFDQSRKKPRFNGSFKEFIRSRKFGIKAWCRHYNSWSKKAGLILHYEVLKQNELDEFSRLTSYCGLHLNNKMIKAAIQRASFKNISKIESKNEDEHKDRFKDGFRFTRSGTAGQWRDSFDENDHKFFEDILSENNLSQFIVNKASK